ncbi:hypothetical protein COCVIDRAFT_33082 [Bipolaris victoriae FI3]|uniref:Uncharacterized protein n=2 Tax=Bipolaris TaxID=33194 RepID=W6Y107_COCC2|nr:uncharacterized protein COCCADRAFT_101746 [Bipolaris zeicola 26-R-13]XP_014562207.1 hypothetical protein COCVIDRAFT_33082 [Bipolaris victoriae FI3]EUC31245.1 hypothetical protein COCCADRAFT_101746 [Bipolaris zeicola 26-R-13]
MCPVLYQMLANTFVRSSRRVVPASRTTLRLRGARPASTLAENPHIYVHKDPFDPSKQLLSLLPTEPPTPQLAIGTCTALPPTPRNFTENPQFLPILYSVFAAHAAQDPYVQSQAAVYASPGGSNLSQPNDGAGGANHQGGMGGGGHGGWIHISDLRNPPDYGRIAWPEDIFGSVEVDAHGRLNGGDGAWQNSGTYRIVTREGILGLTEFMRGKMVEKLLDLERQIKQNS